jgi:hypothetical protein
MVTGVSLVPREHPAAAFAGCSPSVTAIASAPTLVPGVHHAYAGRRDRACPARLLRRSRAALAQAIAHHPRRRGSGDQHRGVQACPPGSDARLAAIRRLLLDETLAPGDRIAGCLVTLYGQQDRRAAHDRYLLRRRRHPAQARRGLARRARARGHRAAVAPAQPRQHGHGRQPGLAVGVSRAARRRTPQLPPARPRASPARHPCPGEPAGRMARTRPASTTRSPRRRAGRLAGHSDAPRVPRQRRLVHLRRPPTCAHPR